MSVMAFLGVFAPSFSLIKNDNAQNPTSFADEVVTNPQTSATQDDISIFIRKPTYSVFYNNKLYFIDDADKLLKVYNMDDASGYAFEKKYIDLSSYTIYDFSFSASSIYLMTRSDDKTNIVKIDLDSFKIDKVFEIGTTTYENFYAQQLFFNSTSYTILTFSARNVNPRIVLIKNDTQEIEKNFEIKFNTSDLQNTIKTNQKKVITYQKENDKLYIIIIYNYNIAYCTINSYTELLNLETDEINNIGHTDIGIDSSISSFNELSIADLGFARVNSTDYLAISYVPLDRNASEVTKLYNLDLGSATAKVEFVSQYELLNSKYATFNGEYCSYVDDENQKLFLFKIDNDFSSNSSIINNPTYNINYHTDDEFVYKETNENTKLFDNPWGANPIVEIAQGTDVIKIGTAFIENTTEIKDYDFCMYTKNDENHFGFIKSSTLKEKTKVSVSEEGYKERVAVYPNAILYSLPTTVTKGQQVGAIVPKKIMKIEDNSEIKVLDVICRYTANNIKMVKVCVNGTQVGFMDANFVHTPSEIVEFVITNATIKKDNTTVFLSPSSDATTLTFKLNAGKNVRINGKRDTKTGWTSITFNDEYGNEFSGYIQTDYISADSWSTLQIVGCVLIAINIGLLILILIYKKNHLGGRGQKIEDKNIIEN